MTATSTEIETVVDDLTAHEFEIACDHEWLWPTPEPCPHPARWAAIKSCCGSAGVLCTDCKDSLLQTEDATGCRPCGAVHSPAREAFLYIEPLRKS